MAYQDSDLADLVEATLSQLDRGHWTDLTTDLQDFVFVRQILRKENVTFDGGKNITVRLMRDHARNFQWIGHHTPDETDRQDNLTSGTVPWRHCKNSWTISEMEIAENSGASQIVDLVKAELAGARVGQAEGLEDAAWSKPANSDDDLLPYGVQYWFPWEDESGNTSGSNDYDLYNEGMFSDAIPSGFSNVAGINPATAANKRWRHWSFTYANVTQEDFVSKLRKAAYKCKFMAPPGVENSSGMQPAPRYGYYSVYNVVAPLVNLVRAQNENLGNDVAAKDGEALFHKVSVVPVPWLDQNAASGSNPIYGLPWNAMQVAFLKGRYMKRKGPMPHPRMHNNIVTYEDCTLNVICRNRRAGFVGAVSDPAA